MPSPLALLLIGYPITVHLGVYFDRVEFAAYYLAILLSLPLATYPIHKNRNGMLLGVAFVPLVAVLVFTNNGTFILKAQSPILYCALAYVFGRTLVAGSEPLITRFIRAMDVKVPQSVDTYGRRATRNWTLLFSFLALSCVVLALFASLQTWSWFVNVISYVLVALMFVLDYIIGRRSFAKDEAIGFRQFLRGIIRVNAQTIARR